MGVSGRFVVIGGFNTQPPEGGWIKGGIKKLPSGRFNTQPPEGGWRNLRHQSTFAVGFNTQPPEGGWEVRHELQDRHHRVSTHSRLKAAG